MKYLITLKDGETREFIILDKPVYSCIIPGEGDIQYRTFKECNAKGYIIIDRDNPHYLFQKYIGFIRDEGTMFSIYTNLRNPIIKLERI